MPHEVVAKVLLLNERNEILILRLSEHKLHPHKSLTPDLPGGIVDPGESEHAAMIREVREETGIVLDPDTASLVHAETIWLERERKSVVKLLYVARLDSTPDVTLSWEHSAYEWGEVSKLINAEDYRSSYKQATAYVQNKQLI